MSTIQEHNNPIQITKIKRLEELGTIEQARIHSSAQRPLKIIGPLTDSVNVCSCCCLPSETKGIIVPFEFTDSNAAFASTGIGTFLYFYFFQYIIFVAFIAMSMAAIPTMIISHYYITHLKTFCRLLPIETAYHTSCKYFPGTKHDWLLYFNGEIIDYYQGLYRDNIMQSYPDYNLINFLTLLVIFIINILFIILVRNEVKLADLMQVSPSNYSLLVENIRNAVKVYNEMKNDLVYLKETAYSEIEGFQAFLFHEVIQCNNADGIKGMNLCFKLRELVKLEKQKHETETKIIEASYSPKQIELNKKQNIKDERNGKYYSTYWCWCCCYNKRATSITEMKRDTQKDQKKIDAFIEQCNTDPLNSFANALFITFDTIKQKEKYYDYFNKNVCQSICLFFLNIKHYVCCCESKIERKRFLRKKRLKVSHAPEPEDVIWENLEVTLMQRIIRQIGVYVVGILLITISIGFLIPLHLIPHCYRVYSDRLCFETIYVASSAVSIIITTINATFQYLFVALTHFERHKTKTDFYISYSVKLAIFTFVNSAIVPYVSNMISGIDDDMMHSYLVQNMFFIFICNSILTPAVWLLNIKAISRKIKILCCLTGDKKVASMSQKELNEVYDLPSMDISFKYSYLISSMTMCLVFLPIFPLGVAITFIGLIFSYCIERFNFTKIHKRPEMLNHKLCLFYLRYFIVILFAYAVSNWIFFFDVFQSNTFAYINIILFGLLILFPYLAFTKCNIFKITESEVHQKTYDDLYFQFANDFERMNPMTRTRGMQTYLLNLKKNSLISQKTYDHAIGNLSKVNLLETYYKSTLYQDNYYIGCQMLKRRVIPNLAMSITRTQTMRSEANSDQPKLQRIESQIGLLCPVDQQINSIFTLSNPSNNNNSNSLSTDGNAGEHFQRYGYFPFNVFSNPFMNNGLVNAGYNISSFINNILQNLPDTEFDKRQLNSNYFSNNPNENMSNDPLNCNNNTNTNNNTNQGYPNQDIQIQPHDYNQNNDSGNPIKAQLNILQSNSNKNSNIVYDPFAIMNNDPILYKRNKQPDILSNTYKQIEEDVTPGNSNMQLHNYHLGPLFDQPKNSFHGASQNQRNNKNLLDPIIQSNLDENKITDSIHLQNKEKPQEDSIIENIDE